MRSLLGGVVRWRRRPARFVLRTAATLIPSRRRAVRDFMTWYRARFPASHHVVVTVYDSESLAFRKEDGSLKTGNYGVFWMPWYPKVAERGPAIYVAARKRRTERVLQTLGHELAHYEEWARTGWSTERGKNQRGDALVRQYLRERAA